MSMYSPTFLGGLAYRIGRLLLKTLRVRICKHPSFDLQGQYIYGFWHNKQLVPILVMTTLSKRKYVGLVSTSKDGEILVNLLSRLGYEVIRGSSSRKAISGVVKLMTALKEGYCVGIAADGPRGPRYAAKAGVSFLASKSGVEIVPLGVAYSRRWQFNRSWDHYQIPYPFAKTVIYMGEPLRLDPEKSIDVSNTLVAKAISEANEKAQDYLHT